MINIAIVEDEAKAAEKLQNCLEQYSTEYNTIFQISVFTNGMQFLNKYQAIYDIIFMDIEMPLIDGMGVAHKLREIDQTSILIFVTNLTQYAIKGYEVDALDYILKPLNYAAFSMKIHKAIQRCQPKKEQKMRVSTRSGDISFSISTLIYIESNGHTINYHTENGVYSSYGTLKKVEQTLPSSQFFRCNSGIIINMNYVTGYDGHEVLMNKVHLPLSRARKKDFIEALHLYHISMGRIS